MPRKYESLHRSVKSLIDEIGLNDPKEIIIRINDPNDEDGVRIFLDGTEIDRERSISRFSKKSQAATIEVRVGAWDEKGG